jgi:hypothetical protein
MEIRSPDDAGCDRSGRRRPPRRDDAVSPAPQRNKAEHIQGGGRYRPHNAANRHGHFRENASANPHSRPYLLHASREQHLNPAPCMYRLLAAEQPAPTGGKSAECPTCCQPMLAPATTVQNFRWPASRSGRCPQRAARPRGTPLPRDSGGRTCWGVPSFFQLAVEENVLLHFPLAHLTARRAVAFP